MSWPEMSFLRPFPDCRACTDHRPPCECVIGMATDGCECVCSCGCAHCGAARGEPQFPNEAGSDVPQPPVPRCYAEVLRRLDRVYESFANGPEVELSTVRDIIVSIHMAKMEMPFPEEGMFERLREIHGAFEALEKALAHARRFLEAHPPKSEK